MTQFDVVVVGLGAVESAVCQLDKRVDDHCNCDGIRGLSMSKKIVACCVAVTLLAAGLKPALAAFPLPSAPVPAATQATIGVAGGAAIGIIATAGIICIVDFWQKLNGLKNWDGSPKVAAKARGHRR